MLPHGREEKFRISLEDKVTNAPSNFVISTCVVLVNLAALKGEVIGILKLPAAKRFLNTVRMQGGPGYIIWSSNSLRAVLAGDQMSVGSRFYAPFQIGPGAQPTSYTMGTGLFMGVKRPQRGVNLSPPPLPSAAVKNSSAIILLTLRAYMQVIR
jgi:hypothetical protein